MKLDKLALALATAIFDGVGVFLVMAYSLLTGKASAVLTRFAAFHFAPYSWLGAILLLVEYAVVSFILAWIFAWLYNIFVKK